MSGNPYHSSDIGGFYGAEQPTAELFLRWLQATVFSSHIRVHGIGEREPWAFGEEAETIARKWLAFRYRLIPYLEHVIRVATSTGLPVMRAMPLAFPVQRAHPALRDPVPVRRRAPRRADHRARRGGGDRAAAGRLVRPQLAQALRRPAGAEVQGGARPVPGVRARGLRAAARARGAAHRRDRSDGPRGADCGCSASPRSPSKDRACASRSTGTPPGCASPRACRSTASASPARSTGYDRAREPARARHHVGRAGRHRPGAVRDARRAPRADAASMRGSWCWATVRCCEQRAARIGVSPRFADYDPAAYAAPGTVEVWHMPVAVPAVPGQPDATNANAVLEMLRHASDACATGAFDAMVTAPVQKSTILDAGYAFSGHTEFLAERTRTRARRDAACARGRGAAARGAGDHAPGTRRRAPGDHVRGRRGDARDRGPGPAPALRAARPAHRGVRSQPARRRGRAPRPRGDRGHRARHRVGAGGGASTPPGPSPPTRSSSRSTPAPSTSSSRCTTTRDCPCSRRRASAAA